MSNGPGPGTSMKVDLPLPVSDATGKQYVFVDPRTPIHIGGPGGPPPVNEVKLTNNTGATATLWFPNADKVFNPSTSSVSGQPVGVNFSQLIPIPAAGVATLKVNSAPSPGSYHYHIYCDAVKDCAIGNSEPQVDVP